MKEEIEYKTKTKIELYHDHFENAKVYQLPKAQLILADIPYNIGRNAYASRKEWYQDGNIKKGKSEMANKLFFDTDENFNIKNFFAFCSRYLKPEPKELNKAPAMIIFCSIDQINEVIESGLEYGFKHHYVLHFIKNNSSQILKANIKIVNAVEVAVVLYRDKLPKFNNIDENGKKHMIKNWFNFTRDKKDIPKIHPTQKPVCLLKELIKIFTDEEDVVIDPCAGSGSTLRACKELNRSCYGFEIKKEFVKRAKEEML